MAHRPDCPAFRPLALWREADLDAALAEADRSIAAAEAAQADAHRACAEAHRRHLELLEAAGEANRRVGNLCALRRGIIRERALRAEHPFTVAEWAEPADAAGGEGPPNL